MARRCDEALVPHILQSTCVKGNRDTDRDSWWLIQLAVDAKQKMY